jgi:Spy/CpxP family protein refolding chaperone
MKKSLLIVLAVVLAMVLATGAFAVGPGYGAGPGGGSGYGPMGGGQVTPEQAQAFTKFQNEILPLKQKMLQLRTELINLRSQTPTDWNAIAAKQKQMVDVRTAIQQKAVENGFAGYGRHGRGMGGYGRGMGGCGMF